MRHQFRVAPELVALGCRLVDECERMNPQAVLSVCDAARNHFLHHPPTRDEAAFWAGILSHCRSRSLCDPVDDHLDDEITAWKLVFRDLS